MSGTPAISTTSRRELSSSLFFLQGNAPKEIHAILTEALACFFPVRDNDLAASLYRAYCMANLNLQLLGLIGNIQILAAKIGINFGKFKTI